MNNIVRETSAEIRAIARVSLKGNWFKVFIGVILFYALMTTVPEALDGFFPQHTVYNEVLKQEISTGGLSSIYTTVLTGAFTVGISNFFLAFFRKNDINPGYIFSGFECFLKTLALFLLTTLFVALWSILLIVPGIIAAFRYSQVFFILADDPSKGVMQCINESKELMKGNKFKYFSLNLSFIGWYMLGVLVITLAAMPFAMLGPLNGVVAAVFDLVISIPLLFVMVYSETANTAFYDLVSGNLVAKSSVQDPFIIE